jgi:pimeloyl-ACP methyl ester carboxylesterase
MAHGFSATMQGMVADRYAEAFHEAGFAVLLYDHRNFGASDGRPRQEINKWVQARGYSDAIDFLVGRNEVDADRIALWGDSSSAGEVLIVGAIDRRARAVIAQVPACGDEPPPADADGSLFSALKETLVRGDVRSAQANTLGPLPVVSSDQLGAPSLLTPLTAFRWFIEYGGRFGTLWENWATFGGPEASVPFHPALCTPHLEVPLLMMIAPGDEMPGASDRISRIAFELAAGPKELVDVEGGHFGLLYHPGPVFGRASQRQLDFLRKQLL